MFLPLVYLYIGNGDNIKSKQVHKDQKSCTLSQRCADPTELSSNFSSAICQSCTKGTLLMPKRLPTHSGSVAETEEAEVGEVRIIKIK